jgi:hypothetical protein
VIVLKGFVSMKMETSRQAMVDNKSLRDPFYATALADEPVTHQVLLDDDGDAIVEDTGGVVDTEDDDKAIPFADDDDADEALANADEVDDDDDTVVMIDPPISPSVNRDPISLHLIGERHSGTKWMSEHLHKCFPDIRFNNNLYRWKHWFQDESVEKFPGERFVVVAQFRNAYTWTEGSKSLPKKHPLRPCPAGISPSYQPTLLRSAILPPSCTPALPFGLAGLCHYALDYATLRGRSGLQWLDGRNKSNRGCGAVCFGRFPSPSGNSLYGRSYDFLDARHIYAGPLRAA